MERVPSKTCTSVRRPHRRSSLGRCWSRYVLHNSEQYTVRASHVILRKSRQITAFSLNRMDVYQRKGLYPVPQDASEILGVEFAGHVTALGPDTSATWAIGDQVLGLSSGVSQHCSTCNTSWPSFEPSFSWSRVPMQNLLLYRKHRSSASRLTCLGWRPRVFQRLSSLVSTNSAPPSRSHILPPRDPALNACTESFSESYPG